MTPHDTANLLIWLTSAVVPAVLLWHSRRQPSEARRVYTVVAVFVAAGGTAHALQALPPGRTGVAVPVAATAVVLAAAVALLRHLPRALAAADREARGEDLERLRLLEAAVTASGDGVMIADALSDEPGPRVVYANPAFERMMGYSAAEAVGLSPSVFCHPESADARAGESPVDPITDEEEAGLTAVRAALRGTEPVRLELPNRRKDGTRVWAEWQIVPVADEAGAFTHWIAILRDTTARRQLEEQLRESQKMDAIGRLAGGIAHDFNNLLTVIRGNAELLHEAGPGTPTVPGLIEDIRGAADRATGLVRQLLTFGRRHLTRPEVVDLNGVVGDMAALLRRVLGERVTVVTAFTAAAVRARVDRGQLEQVVMNLAVNARDAMPRGGTLTIGTTVVTEPRGGGLPPNRFARLGVSDTGTGMTAEVRSRIFEPFFTTKGPGGGTGLGLATVYGIVAQAGGRIGLDSAPGAGTAFRVDLPWCDEPPGSSFFNTPSPPRNRLAGAGRSVLLAEDEEGVRRLARAALGSCGYDVTDAEDGETALAHLTAGKTIDVLVTDLTMPGIGGRELAGRVREALPNVGVVFISGYAAEASWLEGIPGAVFLPKPFTPADLTRAAERAISRVAKIAARRPDHAVKASSGGLWLSPAGPGPVH